MSLPYHTSRTGHSLLTSLRRNGFWCIWGLIVLAASLIITSCSQEKQTFPNKQWHDLNAHYNAYFLAKEKLKEVDKTVFTAHKDNYNRPLPVIVPVSEATEKAQAAPLLEVIKKASIPIQRHKNSDWVDDSYMLIGRARLYKKEENDLAIQTFKYVNAKSLNPDMRHSALIWLMRSYIQTKDLNNARICMDYLRKQALIKENMRDYLIVKAWFFEKEKEEKQEVEALSRAVALMHRSETKARLLFLCGQLFQRQGQDSLAYAHFLKCIRLNPPYELAINARLKLGAVTSINDAAAVKRLQKYFRKMLTDPKNEDYKDKILYEMGRFSQKRSLLSEAKDLYNQSLRSKVASPGQKGYTYWRLAEIYYDVEKNFPKAKLYFDSTVAALDTAEEKYKFILKRQKILADFVKEYQIVTREDSLQMYAKMDSLTREKRIAMLVKRDELLEIQNQKAAREAKKEAERIKRAQEANNTAGTNQAFNANAPSGATPPTGDAGAGSWYFSSPTAVSAGRQDFVRKWGNRPLVDDWRRISKAKQNAAQADADSAAKGAKTPTAQDQKPADGKKDASADGKSADKDGASADGKSDGKSGGKSDGKSFAQERRELYLRDVPFAADKLAESNNKLKVALFNIGKIYEQYLEETPNAERSFLRVVTDYKEYEKVPEALYFLYFIYFKQNQADKAEAIKKRLIGEFPESIYAKLLLNPNYLKELKESNDQVVTLYKKAYEFYENDQFVESQQLIASVNASFKEHGYKDRFKLLETLILGKSVDYRIYKDSLKTFIERNPKSEVVAFAKDMLTVGEAFQAKLEKERRARLGPDSTSKSKMDSAAAMPVVMETPYSDQVKGSHYYMAIIPLGAMEEAEIYGRFGEFNETYYPDKEFTTRTRLLDERHILFTVADFSSSVQALNYLKKQMDDRSAIKDLVNRGKVRQFVITPDNLKTFYGAKNVAEYDRFFKKHYDMSEL